MDKRRLCTRRQLLKTAGLVLGASALASLERWLGAPIAVAQDPAPAHACYFPMISVAPPPASVVHVHNLGATTWNGQADYWNQVNQNVVNPMVDAGLQNLTATPTIQDAWQGRHTGLRQGRHTGLRQGRHTGLRQGRHTGLRQGRHTGLRQGRHTGLPLRDRPPAWQGRHTGLPLRDTPGGWFHQQRPERVHSLFAALRRPDACRDQTE
jgi:hypothetical protein